MPKALPQLARVEPRIERPRRPWPDIGWLGRLDRLGRELRFAPAAQGLGDEELREAVPARLAGGREIVGAEQLGAGMTRAVTSASSSAGSARRPGRRSR